MRIAATLALLASCAAGLPAAAQPVQAAHAGMVLPDGQMQVGRYTTIGAAPAPAVADPLGTWVRISYPRQAVSTVGDALRHTLTRTGWRLADAGVMGADAHALMQQPLPDSHRQLGPYSVRTVLEVLTGAGWQWWEDTPHRVVWFGAATPAMATRASLDAADMAAPGPAFPQRSSFVLASSDAPVMDAAQTPARATPVMAPHVAPIAMPAAGEHNPKRPNGAPAQE